MSRRVDLRIRWLRLLKLRTKAGLLAGVGSPYAWMVKTAAGGTGVQIEYSSRRGPAARVMVA